MKTTTLARIAHADIRAARAAGVHMRAYRDLRRMGVDHADIIAAHAAGVDLWKYRKLRRANVDHATAVARLTQRS